MCRSSSLFVCHFEGFWISRARLGRLFTSRSYAIFSILIRYYIYAQYAICWILTYLLSIIFLSHSSLSWPQLTARPLKNIGI
jgi:hypothetical protein